MTKDNPIKFTLLTACKNEEVDIHLAIESALAQTYPLKEIIFVDDSTDSTKEIIRGYANRGVILIDGEGKGCCQARNLGMRHATEDVIVFLTADTNLEPGYLEKILPYYEQGYDYVMAESYSNLDTVYSRFVQAEHLIVANRPNYNPFTTQGYSVRRTAALAVGGISGGDYPVNFCRDWTLVKKMEENGYKGIIDRSIIVSHKSPDNFQEYWRVQKTRGLMSAYQPYFLFHRSVRYLLIKFIAKSVLSFLHFALIVPAVWHTSKLAKYSKHPIRYFIHFYYAYFIHRFARCVGEWQGWFYILRFNNRRREKSLENVIV
ncbi:glycosyltransferase family 2 protein [Candidatus Wolfebacteria bacterium]|nr:glycosyltransferase family 2 protein [Candidatus Wolfebacteria bacterium]